MNIPEFEKEISKSYIPQPPRKEFAAKLLSNFQNADREQKRVFWFSFSRAVSALILLAVMAVVLIIGPTKVWAQLQTWFGFSPGVGVVRSESEISVLKETVRQTQAGVTVEITSVTATNEKTVIDYRIIGVPREAYNESENQAFGCQANPYLLTETGEVIETIGNRTSFAALPKNTTDASLVLPCLPETQTGKAPENWNIPFSLVRADIKDVALPIIEDSESEVLQETILPETSHQETTLATIPQTAALQIEKVIKTQNGYIMIGAIPNHDTHMEWLGSFSTSRPVILDSNQKRLHTFEPANRKELMEMLSLQIDAGNYPWMVETDSTDIAFPVSIEWEAQWFNKESQPATASFEFDTAQLPVHGSEIMLNQDLQLGKDKITIQSIRRTDQGFYEFTFLVPAGVASFKLNILNSPSNWVSTNNENGILTITPFYDLPPEGMLKVVLSNTVYFGKRVLFTTNWAPSTLMEETPTESDDRAVCLLLNQFTVFDKNMANLAGKLLFTEPFGESGAMGLAVYDLDGTNRQVVSDKGSWGEFSPDGQRIAYQAGSDQLIHIYELRSGEDIVVPHAIGLDIKWSPDGSQLAYVNTDPQTGVSLNIINTDGTDMRVLVQHMQVKNIGFSQSDGKLYFTKQYLPESKDTTLHSIDPVTGQLANLGTLTEPNVIFFDRNGSNLYRVSNRTGTVYLFSLIEDSQTLYAEHNEFGGGIGDSGVLWGSTRVGDPYKKDQYAIVDYNKCQGWLMDYSVVGGSLMDIFFSD